MRHPENKRLPWQHLITIGKIFKMTDKGVNVKSESFFQYLLAFWSYGENIPPPPPPGPDRVKPK